MVSKFSRFMMMGAAVGMIGGMAQAASVESLITSRGDASVNLSDENRENLINRVGDDNIIDEGDSIFGVFRIDQLFFTGAGAEETLGENGNDELTGIFQVLVTSKTPSGSNNLVTGTPNFNYTFAPDPEFVDDRDLAEGTIAAFYEDASPDAKPLDLGSLSDTVDVTTNGDLFMEVGFTGEGGTAALGEAFVGVGPDAVSAFGGNLPAGLAPANTNFWVSRTSDAGDGGDLNLAGQVGFAGEGEVEMVGNSNIRGPGDQDVFDFTSDATFGIEVEAAPQVIPLPAAVWPAMALMGLLGGAKLYRRQSA